MSVPFVYDEEGEKVLLPYRMEVCWRCEGKGSHVNPAIDGNGISADDEIWQDEDFVEGYFGGRYDVVCDECKGRNVIAEVDREACKPHLIAEYDADLQAKYEVDAMYAAERAMGA